MVALIGGSSLELDNKTMSGGLYLVHTDIVAWGLDLKEAAMVIQKHLRQGYLPMAP